MRPIEVIREDGFTFAIGLLGGLVCSNLSKQEIERRLAQHPPGTKAGWKIKGEPKPCDLGIGYLHYNIVC